MKRMCTAVLYSDNLNGRVPVQVFCGSKHGHTGDHMFFPGKNQLLNALANQAYRAESALKKFRLNVTRVYATLDSLGDGRE